mmetsp:Transcript_19049/g.53750  ORF Transcript_19049/g.53750 Transcript_19049/m.53750 type:complete len:230 (-) Transcript_19049:984-1673(-)
MRGSMQPQGQIHSRPQQRARCAVTPYFEPVRLRGLAWCRLRSCGRGGALLLLRRAAAIVRPRPGVPLLRARLLHLAPSLERAGRNCGRAAAAAADREIRKAVALGNAGIPRAGLGLVRVCSPSVISTFAWQLWICRSGGSSSRCAIVWIGLGERPGLTSQDRRAELHSMQFLGRTSCTGRSAECNKCLDDSPRWALAQAHGVKLTKLRKRTFKLVFGPHLAESGDHQTS